MARPGIMIYFDIREPIKWLPDADKGRLFDAILEYGEQGTVPEFDGMLAMAWGFIKPKLDKDGDSYENSKAQRQYAAFCKKRSAAGLGKILFEDWADMDEEERRWRATSANGPLAPVNGPLAPVNGPLAPVNGPLAPVNGRYPSTSTSTTTATTPTTTATTTTNTTANTTSSTTTAAEEPDGACAPVGAAALKDDEKMKMLMNEIKGMNLSQFQTDLLLNKLGVDMFINYAKRLRASIASGNDPGSHMSTILWWYAQDHGT